MGTVGEGQLWGRPVDKVRIIEVFDASLGQVGNEVWSTTGASPGPAAMVVTASGTVYCAINTSADWLAPKGEVKERTAPPGVVP
jgi:hypothetical protein